MSESPNLLRTLKQYFGFDSFRPLQEQIIRDALADSDVFALLPTGGGKSLCFQLPALVRPGLTVVVSPLIALMKDQVDALQASGVAATFLNSSLAPGESRERLRGLHNGEFRLLYVAPERLMLSGFLERFAEMECEPHRHRRSALHQRMGPRFPARISAARATSRDLFPNVPFMALTATATDRVRADIVEASEAARAGLLRREFQSAEPHLSRHPEGQSLRTDAGVRARAPARERHRLLPEPQERGERRRATRRRTA